MPVSLRSVGVFQGPLLRRVRRVPDMKLYNWGRVNGLSLWGNFHISPTNCNLVSADLFPLDLGAWLVLVLDG